jgi:hypothetical protein
MNEKTNDGKASQQVAKQEAKTPALNISTFVEDAASGLENVAAEDLAIPFLRIAQAMSPQVNERESVFIKGCKQGDIFNTVDDNTYKGDVGVEVIPVAYKRNYLEWAPERKGLVAVHDSSEILKDVTKGERNQDVLPNGNLLQTTANHYVLVLDGEGGFGQAILAFAGSQLKKSRKWNSIMSGLKMSTSDGKVFTPPTYSHKYSLKTVMEQNDQGSWFGWDVSIVGQLTAEDSIVYAAAKQFAQNVNAGAVQTSTDESVI